jgi:predicted lipid-binding transport protein (Tim44 family)
LSAPAPPPPPSRPEVSQPPLKSRRLETQLMTILGAGFGLGVALAVTRLFAGLAPGLTIAGLVAGGLMGLLLTLWVVGIRALLHDRAVLDRWVTDVTAALRSAVEERVATRVLAAETALTSEMAARDEVESAAAADRVAEVDAELREHAVASAKAVAVRDRRVPLLHMALDAVRAELYGASAEARIGQTNPEGTLSDHNRGY